MACGVVGSYVVVWVFAVLDVWAAGLGLGSRGRGHWRLLVIDWLMSLLLLNEGPRGPVVMERIAA